MKGTKEMIALILRYLQLLRRRYGNAKIGGTLNIPAEGLHAWITFAAGFIGHGFGVVHQPILTIFGFEKTVMTRPIHTIGL